MAVFVDLEDEDIEPPLDGQPLPTTTTATRWTAGGGIDAVKVATAAAVIGSMSISRTSRGLENEEGGVVTTGTTHEPLQPADVTDREDPNQNSITKAFGCYPIIITIASSLDLNTLDNLSRTCRQVRQGLLQYRKMLLASTLRCCNEHLPVDPDETLRFRARARNWFYMDDAAGRGSYSGKSGQCARDLVGGCRRCGTVVCRNCAIKPPASIALRDRHRRICAACTKAPLGHLVRPRLDASLSLASSDDLQRAICKCASDGVWLCQPCGRTIRSDDYDYKNIWKWRHQYTDVLGGLGTGIGDGDRGVICGRGAGCCAARERAEEVDCDAEDAREATTNGSLTPSPHQQQQQQPSSSSQNNNNQQHSSLSSLTLPPWGTSSSSGGGGSGGNAVTTATTDEGRTTPSPAQLHKPGYVRQEVEGIGGRIKKKLLRIVRVGACVPEWADERDRGSILGREVQGRVRSWCGWCWRVIPGEKDYECMEGEGDVEEKKG